MSIVHAAAICATLMSSGCAAASTLYWLKAARLPLPDMPPPQPAIAPGGKPAGPISMSGEAGRTDANQRGLHELLLATRTSAVLNAKAAAWAGGATLLAIAAAALGWAG